MCFKKPLKKLYIHQYPVDLTSGQYPIADDFSFFLQQVQLMHVICNEMLITCKKLRAQSKENALAATPLKPTTPHKVFLL